MFGVKKTDQWNTTKQHSSSTPLHQAKSTVQIVNFINCELLHTSETTLKHQLSIKFVNFTVFRCLKVNTQGQNDFSLETRLVSL